MRHLRRGRLTLHYPFSLTFGGMQRRALLIALIAGTALAPRAGPPAAARPRQDPGFPNIGYATWSEDEPVYRLFPGDEVDFQVGSAPELNKILTVQPDGRVY